MRLPIASPLQSRNGSANKDARLTNMLKEVSDGSEKAVIRPGLATATTTTGAGNGLVVFNGTLMSVYGATLGYTTITGTGVYGAFIQNAQVLTPNYGIANVPMCAYGASAFLVINTDGDVYRSLNGAAWRLVGNVGTVLQGTIASDGTSFCFIPIDGGNGDVLMSYDSGQTWVTYSAALPFSTNVLDTGVLWWDGTKYISSLDNATSSTSSVIYTSTDGVTWTLGGTGMTLTGGPASQMATGAGKTVASCGTNGAYYTSDHGANWTHCTGIGTANQVAFGNGVFVALDNTGGAYTSAAGTVFASTGTSVPVTVGGLAFDGARFIATGTSGYYTSTDGITWTLQDASVTGTVYAPVCGASITVAFGNTGSTTVLLTANAPNEKINTLGTVTNARFDFAQGPL